MPGTTCVWCCYDKVQHCLNWVYWLSNIIFLRSSMHFVSEVECYQSRLCLKLNIEKEIYNSLIWIHLENRMENKCVNYARRMAFKIYSSVASRGRKSVQKEYSWPHSSHDPQWSDCRLKMELHTPHKAQNKGLESSSLEHYILYVTSLNLAELKLAVF